MTDEAANGSAPGLPTAVDRATFQSELDTLRIREKAHTRVGETDSGRRASWGLMRQGLGGPR